MEYKEKFNKFGFLILRDVFDKSLCIQMKKDILNYFTDEEGRLLKNTLKNYRDGKQCAASLAFNNVELESLHQIFENKKLNNVLNKITEDKLMFLNHSDAHVDTVAGKGWHTDAINNSNGRSGNNWKDMFVKHDFWDCVENEKYCVIRAAFYLQDHTENYDGLHVVAGSHLLNGNTKEIYLKTKTGDVILFDARLKHRGGSSVVKGNERTAVFWAMGRDNVFSYEHNNAAIARQLYQTGKKEYVLNKNLEHVLLKNNIGFYK